MKIRPHWWACSAKKIRFELNCFIKPSTLEASIRVNDEWVVGGELHIVA
jgi:hypothetical protein